METHEPLPGNADADKCIFSLTTDLDNYRIIVLDVVLCLYATSVVVF